MKIKSIIIYIVLWNTVILLDRLFIEKKIEFRWIADEQSRTGIIWPLLILVTFFISIAIWKSKSLQIIFLKPETNPQEIADILIAISIISGGLLLAFLTGFFLAGRAYFI